MVIQPSNRPAGNRVRRTHVRTAMTKLTCEAARTTDGSERPPSRSSCCQIPRRGAAVATAALVAALALGSCGKDEAPVATGSTADDTTGATTAPVPVDTTEGADPSPPEHIPDGPDGLDDARQRWVAAEVTDYDMTYQPLCFCMQVEITVHVRNGELAGFTTRPENAAEWTPEPMTVDGLFADLEQAIAAEPARIDITWDPATGRPVRYWIDERFEMADEEHGVEVLEFTEVDPGGDPSAPGGDPTSPGSVVTTGTTLSPSHLEFATAALTEPWGCAFGFSVSNPQRTVGLELWAAAPPAAETATELPASGWEARAVIGTRLFANWCTDLPTEPDADITEEWPVVGGTVTVTYPTAGRCGIATAVATVTGLTVEASDGARITLPELTITNDAWGCSAG